MKYKIAEDEIGIETIVKYKDCLRRFIGLEGDLELEDITLEYFIDLKFQLKSQGISPARISSIIFCMRSLLRYCREIKKMDVLDPIKIKSPKKHKKEIVYMKNDEIRDFLDAVDLNTIYGLRFRTLCETLLDTGGRISEILQLDRGSIRRDEKSYYATIIGKGDKERKIYFSPRSMYWINEYFKRRIDDNPAMFVTHSVEYVTHPRPPRRMKRNTLWREFKQVNQDSGLGKHITQHTMRRTFCTNLALNGAPIKHVKDLAGHEKIETTITFYTGKDERALIATKNEFLNYDLMKFETLC